MAKNRALILLLGLIVVVNFIALVLALTDIWPDNPFKEYRWLIGISFLAFAGFLRQALKRKSKTHLEKNIP